MSIGSPAPMMSALIIRSLVDPLVLPAVREQGHEIQMIWDPTVKLMQRIRDGERADGIVAIDWAIDELENAGMLAAGSRRPLVQAAFGIAVAKGAMPPDISTADSLRETLLEIPSLVYSRTGASGLFFERIIDELGIGADVRAKAIVIPAGLTGERVASGDAALAVQQVSELLAVRDIQFVGPFPPEVQETTDFSAALFKDGMGRDGARVFISQLFTPQLRAAYLRSGLVPLFE